MDNYNQRYDTSGHSRENKLHRKKGFVTGVVMGSSGNEDAERKPKFVSNAIYPSHAVIPEVNQRQNVPYMSPLPFRQSS